MCAELDRHKSWINFLENWSKEGKELSKSLIGMAQYWKGEGIENIRPFSTRPRTDYYKDLSEWTNQFDTDTTSSTFTKIPFLRIDYILYDKRFKSTNYKKDNIILSDHFPISCEIQL